MKRDVLICLLLCYFGTIAMSAQEHRALVIGIGQYDDARWAQIHGDTDADYVLKTLKAGGFKDVLTLRNAGATKSAIVSAFFTIERSSHPGDRIYIHFSGHGQQITDRDGDEEDGYDEAWIPFDAQPYYSDSYKGENHLIDDEVNRMLMAIRKKIGSSGRLLVVVDACHSGSATREPGDSTISRGFDKKFEIPGKKPKPKPQATEDWITISACQPYQVNWEVTNPAVGKLTWCLYCLRGQLGELTNDKLTEAIIRIMQENPGPLGQTPMLSGNLKTESVKDLFD